MVGPVSFSSKIRPCTTRVVEFPIRVNKPPKVPQADRVQ